MDTLVQVNAKTAGRDKMARLFQYLSRLLWSRMNRNKDYVNALKNLEFQLSTFRKLLRFGRFVDSLYATLPLYHLEDPHQRYTLILGKIANALFLFTDHILWLGRANVATVDLDKWGTLCNKYWLFSITMNLMRDFYEITNILKKNESKIISGDKKIGTNSLQRIYKIVSVSSDILLRQNRDVVIDTIKNGCDLFIPLTNLKYLDFSPGTVGLLGTISSLAGLAAIADPVLKLPYT